MNNTNNTNSNSSQSSQSQSKYTKLIMKDIDQRISGIPIKTMMRQTKNTLISSPLRERYIDSLKQDRFHASTGTLIVLLQAKSWMGGR
jgi:hypothetical protein